MSVDYEKSRDRSINRLSERVLSDADTETQTEIEIETDEESSSETTRSRSQYPISLSGELSGGVR
jgi:hypothetical protein